MKTIKDVKKILTNKKVILSAAAAFLAVCTVESLLALRLALKEKAEREKAQAEAAEAAAEPAEAEPAAEEAEPAAEEAEPAEAPAEPAAAEA